MVLLTRISSDMNTFHAKANQVPVAILFLTVT